MILNLPYIGQKFRRYRGLYVPEPGGPFIIRAFGPGHVFLQKKHGAPRLLVALLPCGYPCRPDAVDKWSLPIIYPDTSVRYSRRDLIYYADENGPWKIIHRGSSSCVMQMLRNKETTIADVLPLGILVKRRVRY